MGALTWLPQGRREEDRGAGANSEVRARPEIAIEAE
jgi:hypothetical protein